MKKSVIILIAVVAVIIIWAISAYNGLVDTISAPCRSDPQSGQHG